AIGAITPQHSQHLIIFVKKSVAIPLRIKYILITLSKISGRLSHKRGKKDTEYEDSVTLYPFFIQIIAK
ncbi:hypothetical protein, partial [Enterococcus avium]|uniref:hypothetical protein n=1 Tax=Enterococcus avium TaxID=33945 RepID=UPI001F563F2C